MRFVLVCLTALLAFPFSATAEEPEASKEVFHRVIKVNGLRVNYYAWDDSKGLRRTVSLKQQHPSNPGNGGYAIQMTYEVGPPNARRKVTVNADPNDGFGYFVSHERYRTFADDTSATIAAKIFGRDDSPLGRGFPVVGKRMPVRKAGVAAHRFTMTYPRYGTIQPIAKDANGNDVIKLPTNQASYRLYDLPIMITWFFEVGTDYPRIETRVDLRKIPGPDRVNFDVRGPYGVMRFDNGTNVAVDRIMWGDRFHFRSLTSPVTRGAAWIWANVNRFARYHSLNAGGYEMGLFEPRPYGRSLLADGYADSRGNRSTVYNNGNGCMFQNQILPCDWEWPYQSLQYSLPGDMVTPTNYKKMAWGSTGYFGTGDSLRRVYDSPTTSKPFNGWPRTRVIIYSTCVVLGQTIPHGLTRTAASKPANYNCAHL